MDEPTERWPGRRLLAALLDVSIFLAPIAAASATLWVLTRRVSGLHPVWRVLVLLGVATLVAAVVQRLVRRFLPLTALLRLTMVFPDRAPSRFAVAREAGNPRELMGRLESGDVDEATAARNILALVGALAAHDRKTRGHSERIRAYTDLLSNELGLDDSDRDRLRWSALLHDIGKLRVDAAILNKAGKPTDAEWDALRSHPHHGEVLAGALLPWLGVWGQAIVEHHERFDGAGYPHGLAGTEISLGGRILAVVDSFETMTAVRSYKKAMSHRTARFELARCAGSQFDAAVVRSFLGISLPRLIWAMGPFSALLQLPWATSLQYAGSRAVGMSTATAAIAGPVIAAGVVTAAVAPAAAAAPHHPGHGPSRPAPHAVVTSHHDHRPADATTSGPGDGGSSLPRASTAVSPSPSAHGSTAAPDPTTGTTGSTGPTGSPQPSPSATPTLPLPIPVPLPTLSVSVPPLPLPTLSPLPLPSLPLPLPTLPAL
jgi:HD domain